MRNSIKMVLVLTIVSLLSGTVLVFVYTYAQPQIVFNQNKELKEAVFKVMPNINKYETIDRNGKKIYVGKTNAGKILGYALIVEGSGYQGNIIIMVGLDSELRNTTGMEILESNETPGLGGMINSEDFKKSFKNLLTYPKIELVKDIAKKENEIEAITGATISSKAVIDMLNKGIEEARKNLKK